MSFDSEQWVPSLKDVFQLVVKHFRPCLQQQVRPSQRPMHLLPLDEASAHDLVDRRFDKRRADRFPLPVPLAVVRDRFLIVANVGVELRLARRQFLRRRSMASNHLEVHKQVGQPLEERSRALILAFAKRFAGRVSGLVVHDQTEMGERRDEYLLAVREVGFQLEKIENSPCLFLEYAVGLDTSEFAEFFELVRDGERISACIDVGHMGPWQARSFYSRSHPGENVCSLTPDDPRLPEIIDDVEEAVGSALSTVLNSIEVLGKLGKPLHFHLHDAHPLPTSSPYSDHLSFLTWIPIPFEYNRRWSLDPMYGPTGLSSILSKSLEILDRECVSFTLEIYPPDGRLPLGSASHLFSHWQEKTNAERMNYWLGTLLENQMLVEQTLA